MKVAVTAEHANEGKVSTGLGEDAQYFGNAHNIISQTARALFLLALLI